ncbi:MAG: ATP-binding cassette domain-containing protein [Hydrogenophaga sp.]|uniref:ABC-F family ATP-binding cassette domain-containing protein n=1 Tax=Comamonadaceae TaxID=80864 RepID=UPI002728359F|nr:MULTISPECIES: ATP-binding cassette domain-containing protein [Comamonadaceae]MDO9568107.1 ATP-binding cassette domain-containing protein [Hydrogenophaga sp.]MDP3346265.1 ATP-binding cassette domain-containing protein [Hydrogenophaga sp.]MDP3799362.1 ATP-binding cassette domain-containing protein [Polaromonas sp.]
MITLKNLVLRRGTKVLLDGASCTINPGEKVGLVGRNGAGKSSLFGLLNHTLHEDKGDFYVPAQWRMAQVAQDMPETDMPATQFVIEGDVTLLAAQTEVAAAEASGDGEHMANAYMALHDAGAHDAPARAQALILGLGFRTDELDHPVNSFSGGWRMRLQLARALMCPSDLLLLDEPTNHLDLDALVWLEAWLKRYEGTMLVISHDREFLDAVTDVTIHIERAQLTRYGGNYSRFEDMRAEQMALQATAYSKQQDKMAHLQKFIDRFKAKASKAKQAQSRVKALERMEKIGPVLADAEFTFEFSEPQNLPNPMLAMQDVSFGYPAAVEGGEPTLIVRNVSKSVLAGQRIGILGANGQGKSTVVKTIARDLQALAGTITEGKGLNIGYFAQQELDVLRPADTPLEHMIRLVRECTAEGRLSGQATREQDLRGFLGSFNFTGDQVKQAVGSMSGGEKARLVLCMIVWQRPNLLLLDEPTNHLDLATREALSMALNEFEGTVMLVSHDRALLRAVCDEFWLVSRGGVEPFDGDLDDYQRYLLDMAKQSREAQRQEQRDQQRSSAPVAAPSPAPRANDKAAVVAAAPAPVSQAVDLQSLTSRSPEQRRQDALRRQQVAEKTRPLKKELEQTEKRMAVLALEKTRLETALSQPLNSSDIADSGRRLKAVNDETDTLEARWLELTEAIEAASA